MKKSTKNTLFGIIIGVVISIIFLNISHTYPSYEHVLNSTNPLILGNNNFMLCELPADDYYNYKAIWNSVNSEVDLTKFCKSRGDSDERLYNDYGRENIQIKNMQTIDEFFSGQEEKINISQGIYYITKLRETHVYKPSSYSYYTEVILKIEDKTKGKKYFWET